MSAGNNIVIAARDRSSFTGYLATPPAGSGPGVLVLQEIFGVNENIRAFADRLAEEGYVALAPDLFWRLQENVDLGYDGADRDKAFQLYERFDAETGLQDLEDSVATLRGHAACTGKIGVVGFCLGGTLAFRLAAQSRAIAVAIGYYGGGIEQALDQASGIDCPLVLQFGGADPMIPSTAIDAIAQALAGHGSAELHVYPGATHAFANEDRPSFDKPAAMMAYSRTLGALRRTLGPTYDLSRLWDAHTMYEFGTRDVAATMATMVAEPYVNHIPTMTGGVGQRDLARFYQHHFIPKTPADTKLVPISRTIGADRVVDEMLFCFTHDIEIDWMLPGVAPTGRYVEIPLVAIVNFRGAKLYHEHIYWDQASVLVQVGLLDPEGIPVAGVETARKLVNEHLPSNTLMRRWRESASR